MNKSRLVILVTLLGTFFIWGGWAYFINRAGEHPELALRAALTQATYSTVMTLYMSMAVLFFERISRGWRWPGLWPPLFTVGHTSPLLIFVHVMNGTPNILKTVSLPILVSLIYCSVLTRTQVKQNRAAGV